MSLIMAFGNAPIWSDSEPPQPHVNVVDDTNPKRLIAVARFDGLKAMDHAATFIDAASRIALLESELSKASSAFETAAGAGALAKSELDVAMAQLRAVGDLTLRGAPLAEIQAAIGLVPPARALPLAMPKPTAGE